MAASVEILSSSPVTGEQNDRLSDGGGGGSRTTSPTLDSGISTRNTSSIMGKTKSGTKNNQSSPKTNAHQHTPSSSAGGGGGGGGDGRKVSSANSTTGRNSKSCCFCWCCCYRCTCLSSKNQEEDLNKSKDIASKDSWSNEAEMTPSLEEIRCWGDSFDRLMKSSMGRVVFREFLKCEYSEENILFWLACEDLKKDSNPEVVEEKARLIFEDYISILSPKEVSLDSRVREIVNRNMVDPTLHTFDEAQLQIYTLMHRDSYPRFVNSNYFKKLAQRSTSTRKESSA